MIKLRVKEIAGPEWADDAVIVYCNARAILSLYLKRQYFCANRQYLGIQLHHKPTTAELRLLLRIFNASVGGVDFEANIDKEDQAALRFAQLFGFRAASPVPVDGCYIYERIN